MEDKIYSEYCAILAEELQPAMGCTEPIAVAYRQIPHDPEIRQPRLAQHDKKAPKTAVPLAEQCVLFHLFLPSLSGNAPESKRDPPVLRARRAR